MATFAIVSDHMERTDDLDEQNLDSGQTQVLEEAAHPWGEHRHEEASAPVEKAEETSSVDSPAEPDLTGAPSPQDEKAAPEASVPEEPLATRLVTNIATGLATVLVGAIQDLERHMTGETNRLTSEFGQRLDKLQATIDALQPLSERIENLAQAGAKVQEKCVQLEATTASLQQADVHHIEQHDALRSQVQELSASTGNRMDEVCGRIEGHEREIATAHSALSDLTSRIATAAERLERHAGAVRALHQERTQRAAALDQVAEALTRMRPAQEDHQSPIEL